MFVKPNIARMDAYVPGEQPTGNGYIKINTNENPYPPSPKVIEALLREAQGALNVYPDPHAGAVRDRLAKRFGLDRDMFIVGNGGDDILTIVSRCLVGDGDAIAYPTPTYTLYKTLAELQGSETLEVPYADGWRIPDGLYGNNARLTFVTNPNAPSGTPARREDVKRLAESLRGVLIVDEAYVDFSDENCMGLVGTLPNLCVLRSLSKSFSLAGMRIGYLAGPKELLGEFLKAKESYNIDRLSIAAAAAALDDYEYMLENVGRIRETRGRLTSALAGLGFEVVPSQANFVWAKAPSPGAAEIYTKLKERRILVRFWNREGLRDNLRISVGTPEQIETLLDAVKEIVKGR